MTPEVKAAIAGPRHGATIDLQARTISAEACTWKVQQSLLKITSGKDDVEHPRVPRSCPGGVTVRRAVSTTLSVAWNAKRSDEDCSKVTAWALPAGTTSRRRARR